MNDSYDDSFDLFDISVDGSIDKSVDKSVDELLNSFLIFLIDNNKLSFFARFKSFLNDIKSLVKLTFFSCVDLLISNILYNIFIIQIILNLNLFHFLVFFYLFLLFYYLINYNHVVTFDNSFQYYPYQ